MTRDLTAVQSTASFVFFTLKHTCGRVELLSDQGIKLAVLDVQTTSKLQALSHMPSTRSEAVIDTCTIMKRRHNSKSAAPFEVSINIFGPESDADEVGLALSEDKVYLQHPRALDANIKYYNPDFLTFPGVKVNMRDYIGIGTSFWQADHLKRDVQDILGSLGQVMDNGQNVDPIEGLKTTLTKYVMALTGRGFQGSSHDNADQWQTSREWNAFYYAAGGSDIQQKSISTAIPGYRSPV